MSEEVLTEKQDSIKICKNSKGYTWESKRYYCFDKTRPEEVIKQLQNIDKQLIAKFGGAQNVE